MVERICKGRVINMTKKQIAALRRIIKREQSVYDIAAFNANKCRCRRSVNPMWISDSPGLRQLSPLADMGGSNS